MSNFLRNSGIDYYFGIAILPQNRSYRIQFLLQFAFGTDNQCSVYELQQALVICSKSKLQQELDSV